MCGEGQTNDQSVCTLDVEELSKGPFHHHPFILAFCLVYLILLLERKIMENDKNNDFYCIVQSPSFFSMKVEVVVLLPRASFVALDCTYVQHVGMFLNGKSRR